MSSKRSVLLRRWSRFSANQSTCLNIPYYHLLILAWCAMVILYGDTGQKPPAPYHAI